MAESYEHILEKISALAKESVTLCGKAQKKVSAAESCTGGMISAAITSVPGSSRVIELGICSYSNRIKRQVLGVSAQTLEKYTEISPQCAAEMALGALNASGADYAVSTTGIAGPDGGTDENPVGTVYIGIARKGYNNAERYVFESKTDGTVPAREYIRAQAVAKALEMLLGMLTPHGTAQ